MRSLISSSRLFTAVEPTTAVGKIIQFPIIRMLIAIVFLIPVLLLHNFIYDTYIANIQDQTLKLTLKYVEVSLICLLLFKSYALYTQLIEKRKAIEISIRSASNEIISGFMLGAGLIVLMIILFFITGCIKITSTNSPFILLDHFFKYGIGSLVEELLFTLIIFKLIEEAFGTWTALLFNALLFGFAHIFNDNAILIRDRTTEIRDLDIKRIRLVLQMDKLQPHITTNMTNQISSTKRKIQSHFYQMAMQN